ncbi:MAG: hypothetical protein P1P59_04550 [Treponemataceae bacterium]
MINKIKKILVSYIEDTEKAQEALEKIMTILADGETEKAQEALPENLIVESYDSYNFRRYSKPWIALVENGDYNFSKNVGYYTGGNAGDAGDLVITDINPAYVYAYGQKDYRKNRKNIRFVRVVDRQLLQCDRAGKILE